MLALVLCGPPDVTFFDEVDTLMDALDEVWELANDFGIAGEVPDGTPLGVRNLSHVFRVYNSICGGGLTFVFDVNEPWEVERCISGLRYFELHNVADFLNDALERRDDGDYIAVQEGKFNDLVPRDSVIEAALRRKAEMAPQDFV
jgi:hypothetical protein